jgi:hypothetical protein
MKGSRTKRRKKGGEIEYEVLVSGRRKMVASVTYRFQVAEHGP